jgi:hypothetical protein
MPPCEFLMLRAVIIADNADNVNPDIRVWKSEMEAGESDDGHVQRIDSTAAWPPAQAA